MFSKLKKIKKNGFTMLELILVCTVFALLVSGIILAINRTYIFMNNTRVQIRATNLTREGMEMMFNIRDTNRRKCSGEKDRFWLYLGSGADTETILDNEEKCNPNGKLFEKGIYTIKEGRKNGSGDRFIYAEKLDIENKDDYFYEIDGFFSEDNNKINVARSGSLVTFTGTYFYLSGSAASGNIITGEISDLLGNGVEFYRIARVYGIYCKNSDETDETESCLFDSDPKEMRFCVKTFYKMGVGLHATELCSIMTNFME